MKKAIILHGIADSKKDYLDPNIDSLSNSHWFPWLQQQLILNGIIAQTPELPKAYRPNYEEWLKVFSQLQIDNETILIGHSCGAGFLVRWLSENRVKVGKVILVAPWLDPRGSIRNTFFKFNLDKHLLNKTKGITIFNSDDDGKDIAESVETLMKNILGIKYQEFHRYGHFDLESMQTRQFPELLEEVLK